MSPNDNRQLSFATEAYTIVDSPKLECTKTAI